MKKGTIFVVVIAALLLFAGICSAQQEVALQDALSANKGFCYPDIKGCSGSACRTVQNGPILATLEGLTVHGQDIVATLTVVNLSNETVNISLTDEAFIDASGGQARAKFLRVGGNSGSYGASAWFAPKQPLRAIVTFENGARLGKEVTVSLRFFTKASFHVSFFNQAVK